MPNPTCEKLNNNEKDFKHVISILNEFKQKSVVINRLNAPHRIETLKVGGGRAYAKYDLVKTYINRILIKASIHSILTGITLNK